MTRKPKCSFWRGWQPGRVFYVPGVSTQHPELERDGLSWISIHSPQGSQIGILVDPSTREVQKTVRFVRRADDEFATTPVDYYFGDGEPERARGRST